MSTTLQVEVEKARQKYEEKLAKLEAAERKRKEEVNTMILTILREEYPEEFRAFVERAEQRIEDEKRARREAARRAAEKRRVNRAVKGEAPAEVDEVEVAREGNGGDGGVPHTA